MPTQPWIAWAIFGTVIVGMLLLDLGVFHRRQREIGMREALTWSGIWILSALLFAVAIDQQWIDAQMPAAVDAGDHAKTEPDASSAADPDDSPEARRKAARVAALEFLTGYVIEESLSVDNLFVFVVIFSYFRVPSEYQRKVLYLGILGAVIMRALFIGLGLAIIERFHAIIYVFGVFLIYTGIKLVAKGDEEVQPERNIVLRIFRRMMPITTEYHGSNFFAKVNGQWCATPLFVVLIVVETTDLIFAVDSIPAIIAVTRNPFVVYTSNIFAIMGLRSLYFALKGLMEQFHYLKYGLSAILVFVGAKMLLDDWALRGYLKDKPYIPLGIVLSILAVCVVLSIFKPPHKSVTEPDGA